MSNIQSGGRPSFFIKKTRPNVLSKSKNGLKKDLDSSQKINDSVDRTKTSVSDDAKVQLSRPSKDFGMIKSTIDATQDIDKSKQINRLKQAINSGQYEVDYEAIADKLLSQEHF